jgi:cytochrome P450
VFLPASPFKYPVFHAGPRTCLGREMAYVQMKSIAACMLERYTLRFVGNEVHRRLRAREVHPPVRRQNTGRR